MNKKCTFYSYIFANALEKNVEKSRMDKKLSKKETRPHLNPFSQDDSFW